MRRRAIVLIALVLLVAACGSAEADGPSGIVREPAPDVGAVVLPDASAADEPFVMRADEDRLLLVYFGYTACPDVCPTTLADLRSAMHMMESGTERIDVAMVTVDPIRDDGDRLTDYVQSFFAGAHALRTDDDDLLRTAVDAFGAAYQVVITDGDIDVGHSAFLYAVDSDGLIRLQWAFGASSKDMAADLEYLLEGI